MVPYLLKKNQHCCRKLTFLKLFGTYLYFILCKFSIKISRIDAGTAPSKDAIWEGFSEKPQHQSIKKINVQLILFLVQKGAKLMHILVGYSLSLSCMYVSKTVIQILQITKILFNCKVST